MPPHDDPVRMPARTLLTLALGIAFVSLVVAVLWRAESDRIASEFRDGFAADYYERQETLEQRVTDLAARDADQLAALEIRLRAIDNARDVSGAAPPQSPPAPFAIENVVSSIGQILCLDNVNDDLLYTGSGTVVNERGVIVTNYHNLESEDGSVITYCGVGFSADPGVPPSIDYVAAARAADPENDLAVLQIIERLDGGRLPAAFPAISVDGAGAASAKLKLGDPLYIGGYPGIGAETFTYTQGVVSGRVGDVVIKTSALIDSGTSGGAAFDARGAFVGVPTAAARGEIGGSLGYLVSGDAVLALLKAFAAGENTLPTDRPLR